MELFELTDKEDKIVKKIYKLLEKHIISECGEFNTSYALQNTNVTELCHDLILNARYQIQFSNQIKSYR